MYALPCSKLIKPKFQIVECAIKNCLSSTCRIRVNFSRLRQIYSLVSYLLIFFSPIRITSYSTINFRCVLYIHPGFGISRGWRRERKSCLPPNPIQGIVLKMRRRPAAGAVMDLHSWLGRFGGANVNCLDCGFYLDVVGWPDCTHPFFLVTLYAFVHLFLYPEMFDGAFAEPRGLFWRGRILLGVIS